MLSGKSCLKLFIVSCMFASIPVFSSTSMIWVTLNMGRSATNRQGNVREVHIVCRVVNHYMLCWQQLWSDVAVERVGQLHIVVVMFLFESVCVCVCVCVNSAQITTDYNDDKDCSDCFALQHFNAGDQVLTACHCKLQLCSVIVVWLSVSNCVIKNSAAFLSFLLLSLKLTFRVHP